MRSALCACILAVIAAATQLLSVAAREFRVADNQAPDYPTVQALVFMGRLIEERTEGRHSIRVFHSRQLGEEEETIEQTRVGAIDLARTNIAPMASVVPLANVLALPFLFRSTDHLHAVLDGPVGQEILASFETRGLIGLTYYDSGARSIYTRGRAVRTLDDLKGLRIRVQPSAAMIDFIKALGAVPVALRFGQVETALSTGLIDGAENNWPSYVTANHYKFAPNYTLTEHTMTPEVLVMSKRAWESLSPEDQQVFRESARESSRFMRLRWVELEERSRQRAIAAGNLIITAFARQPFVDAAASIYAKTMSDPALARLIEHIRLTQ